MFKKIKKQRLLIEPFLILQKYLTKCKLKVIIMSR